MKTFMRSLVFAVVLGIAVLAVCLTVNAQAPQVRKDGPMCIPGKTCPAQ